MKKHFKITAIFGVVLSICIALTTIIGIIKATLNNKVIYYYDVTKSDLPASAHLSIKEIKLNYDYVIKFVQSPNEIFHLPTLPYSREGKIHFEEVRNIFTFLDKLTPILFLTMIIIFILNLRYHNYKFFKWSSILLIILPTVCIIPFIINFDRSFTTFHKLFFNNDYWLLDINSDPIINIMPQSYFFLCAMFIIILLILASLIFYLIYRLILLKR